MAFFFSNRVQFFFPRNFNTIQFIQLNLCKQTQKLFTWIQKIVADLIQFPNIDYLQMVLGTESKLKYYIDSLYPHLFTAPIKMYCHNVVHNYHIYFHTINWNECMKMRRSLLFSLWESTELNIQTNCTHQIKHTIINQ